MLSFKLQAIHTWTCCHAWNLMLSLALSSCTLIPKLTLPQAPINTTYPSEQPTNGTSSELPWRQVFLDPQLVKLIEIALSNNRDLRVAMLRVEEARAQYRIERSTLLPNVSQNSHFTRTRRSDSTEDQWSLSFGITSYELDLFGRIRSLNEKALQQYLAKTEIQRAAQVTLIAELASQYYAVQQLEELMANARLTLIAVEESYRLNESMFQAGELLELDLRSSEAQVLTTKANLITYQRQRDQALNGLVLMLGQPAPKNLPPAQPLAKAHVKSISAGLPSDLLQCRPDILEAEHDLRAANADIGAARAAFFPNIKLTSLNETASTDLQNLFSQGSGIWSFSPQISIPLFTGGRNQADLDAAKIRTRIEIANYEKTIQIAFREVADALAAQKAAQEQIHTLESLVAAQQRRYDLAAARDQRGVSPYLNVITAQQDLFSAQQNLISARYDHLAARIKLYQAIGGGSK
jgi:multidrug efflux system outer membrane protein